jgi:aspartyl-tRNA(Asn)/glutamyl-tRNA(Gln) amidotransferase subunit A
VHANITGNPALSIPFAKHQNGMPYGVQVMADRFCENKLFDFFNLFNSLK